MGKEKATVKNAPPPEEPKDTISCVSPNSFHGAMKPVCSRNIIYTKGIGYTSRFNFGTIKAIKQEDLIQPPNSPAQQSPEESIEEIKITPRSN